MSDPTDETTVGTALDRIDGRRHGEKFSQHVARQILRYIIDNRLEEGSLLPDEPRMLEQYQVGRPTLREALRILEVNGLITIRPGRGGGPKVRRSDPADLARLLSLHLASRRVTYRDAHSARRAIEPMLAGKAAQNATETERQILAELLHETEDFGTDPHLAMHLGESFHRIVTFMSHEPVLTLICRALHQIFITTATVDDAMKRLSSDELINVPRWLAEHGPIGEAIIRRDAGEAARLMSEHMEHFASDDSRNDELIEWL